jgi:hypothetical protein
MPLGGRGHGGGGLACAGNDQALMLWHRREMHGQALVGVRRRHRGIEQRQQRGAMIGLPVH